MKKKKCLLFAAFGLLAGSLFAGVGGPGDTVKLQQKLQLSDTFPALTDFTEDPLGNVYILSEKERIVKYDASGKKRAWFSQNRLGPATVIYSGNALKLLVWYPDFRTVLFLDRSLTQIGGPLSLIDAGYPEVRTVGLSADGNIWVYDEVAFKLKKISPTGTLLLESQTLNSIFSSPLSFQQIMDDGQQVVAVDSSGGFFIFDVFAQFNSQMQIEALSGQFFLENNTLRWITTDQQLHTAKPTLPGSEQAWFLPIPVAVTRKKIISGGILTESNGVVRVFKE